MKMKKIIGWTIISATMLSIGFLGAFAVIDKTESEVKTGSTNVEFKEAYQEAETTERVVQTSAVPAPPQPETAEARETRLLREQLLREQYANEDGSYVHVTSLEGENAYIDGIIKNIGFLINYGETEEEAIRVMHLLTHQKVQAKEKWGAAPLTPSTAERLVLSLKKHPDFDPELLRIAKMWQAGDFSEIDSQHNYLTTRLKGNVEEGNATGIATPEEEKEFVLKYFDDSVAEELGFR